MDHLQEAAAEQTADQHQHSADHAAGDHGGGDGSLHFPVSFGAEEHGYDDRASDIAAKGKRDKDQCDLIAVADGREGVLADELTGDKTVRDVIELLEDNAAEKGQAELPENDLWFSVCKIFVQNSNTPLMQVH